MNGITVCALYKFVALQDFPALRESLSAVCKEQGVKGTLLLAEEGINGTIAGSQEGVSSVLDFLKSDERLSDLRHKESYCDENPFYRMKVKLKKEIVTLGVPEIDPTKEVGTYVPAQAWNELISDPEVLLIDTRNNYETATGSFQGALDPNTTNFTEFPEFVQDHLDPKKHKKVAMYCTGGIRCEKATAFMLDQGFDEVYHLEGGILKYLEEVPEEESLWQGECFVFDNRVTVNHQLGTGEYDMCHACRHPISEQDKASPEYQRGVSCPYCLAEKSDEDRQRFAQRQKQIELAASRQQSHIGLSAEDIEQAKRTKQAEKARCDLASTPSSLAPHSET